MKYTVECYSNQGYEKFKYEVKGMAKFDASGTYTYALLYERLVNIMQAGVAMYGEAFLYPENQQLRENLFALRNKNTTCAISNVDLGIESVSVKKYNSETKEYEETNYTAEWAEKFISDKLKESEL